MKQKSSYLLKMLRITTKENTVNICSSKCAVLDQLTKSSTRMAFSNNYDAAFTLTCLHPHTHRTYIYIHTHVKWEHSLGEASRRCEHVHMYNVCVSKCQLCRPTSVLRSPLEAQVTSIFCKLCEHT